VKIALLEPLIGRRSLVVGKFSFKMPFY